MAIQKSYTLPDGRTGNYWLVENVYIAADQQGLRGFCKLYETQAAWASGAGPIHQGDVVLTNQDNPLNRDALVNLVEQKLVTLDGTFLSGVVVA